MSFLSAWLCENHGKSSMWHSFPDTRNSWKIIPFPITEDHAKVKEFVKSWIFTARRYVYKRGLCCRPLSVCLRWCISRWLKISSNFFLSLVAPSLSFLRLSSVTQFQGEPTPGTVKYRGRGRWWRIDPCQYWWPCETLKRGTRGVNFFQAYLLNYARNVWPSITKFGRLTREGRITRVNHASIARGRGPSAAQFQRFLVFMNTPFDAELPNLTR